MYNALSFCFGWKVAECNVKRNGWDGTVAQLYKDGRPDIRGHRPNKSVMLCDVDDDDDGGLALVS